MGTYTMDTIHQHYIDPSGCGLGSFNKQGLGFELCRWRNVVGREDASKGLSRFSGRLVIEKTGGYFTSIT
jgi:hypothetical protein